MSSTKQLMQGWSNTGWSIRDSSCRNCHHYDRVGTYLCPHHRIGHNLECGSCNIRLGTQHLPAIHVRMLRDNRDYRAAYGRAQPAASGLLSGFRRTENRSLQRFVRSGAAQELRAVPVTALSNVAVSPTANRLVSIPMVFIPIHCNGPRHGMDLVMECIGMQCIGVHCIPMHSMTCPRAGGPGKRMKKPGAFSLQYW